MSNINNCGKKSMLFSLMALILLVPIFIISSMHVENNAKQNTHANKYTYAQRLNYIESDIASDIIELLGYDMNNTGYSIAFYDLIVSNQSTSGYRSFIENRFASLINSEINLDLGTELWINNMFVNISDNRVAVTNLSSIRNITLHIKGIEPATLNETTSPVTQFSGHNISLIVDNYYNERVIEKDLILNVSRNNNLFVAKYNTTGLVINISNDQIIIDTNVSLRLELFKIDMTINSTTVKTGNYSIVSYLGLAKKGRIVLSQV